jgi:hypothetical protein
LPVVAYLRAVLVYLSPVVAYLRTIVAYFRTIGSYLRTIVAYLSPVVAYLRAIGSYLWCIGSYLRAIQGTETWLFFDMSKKTAGYFCGCRFLLRVNSFLEALLNEMYPSKKQDSEIFPLSADCRLSTLSRTQSIYIPATPQRQNIIRHRQRFKKKN